MTPQVLLEAAVDTQTLTLRDASGAVTAVYPISTAAKGVGSQPGSLRTPTGRFRVCGKIGDDAPHGAIFRERQHAGQWQCGNPCMDDLVLSRILLLEGLDPHNANTLSRHIYIHGTNREDLIGTPASHGCLRLTNADMIDLYARVPVGAELIIHPPTRSSGKLFFVDCDSTLSSIEGIDELARARGPEVFAEVVALTHAAMNGEVPLDEVFGRRIDLIRPDAATCAQVAALYQNTVMPGMAELISALKGAGWLPVIVSGGFAPLIAPLAADLGIAHVEAVPLHLAADGSYAGYGATYPTTRNGGKNEILREWRAALLPERMVMMGDGVSDLETAPDVDLFVGYGGVVERPKVKSGAHLWLTADFDPAAVLAAVSGIGTSALG